jgi:hypothetical protein
MDLTPTPMEYASIGAMFAQDLIAAKTIPESRDSARAILASLIEVVRYLTLVDQRDGTTHLATLLKHGNLTETK